MIQLGRGDKCIILPHIVGPGTRTGRIGVYLFRIVASMQRKKGPYISLNPDGPGLLPGNEILGGTLHSH